MANATRDLKIDHAGGGGSLIVARVAATTTLYKGTMLSQLTNGAGLVPTTTASSGQCIGVAAHGTANPGLVGAKKIEVETDRVYIFDNHTSNACDEDTIYGALVFAVDDHTVSEAGTVYAGEFRGMEPDGRVRVYVSPRTTILAAALAS